MNATAAVWILAVLVACLFIWLCYRSGVEVEPPNTFCPYSVAGTRPRVCGPWCSLYLADTPHCPFARWSESLQNRRPSDAKV